MLCSDYFGRAKIGENRFHPSKILNKAKKIFRRRESGFSLFLR
jgi:hypothetical protein